MNILISALEKAFYYLISGSSFDHILILILFGIVFQLKDWKKLLVLLLAISLGSVVGFLLACFKISHFSHSLIKLALALTFLAVGIHHLFSNNLSANAIRYNFFAVTGIILGTGISLHYLNVYGSNLKLFSLSGYVIGSSLAYLVLSLSGLIASSIIVALFRTERRKFNLVISGMSIGAALVLLYLRY